MLFSVGRCRCCSRMARVERGVCAECVSEYGERMAGLIGRARVDAVFAEACAARMSPNARASFQRALGLTQPAPIGGVRKVIPSRDTARRHLHAVSGEKKS